MDLSLNAIIFVVLYGSIVALAITLFNLQAGVLLVLMAAVYFYLFFVRRFIRPIAPMILAHMLVLVATWYFATGFSLVLYIATAVALVGFSLYQRYRRATTFSSEFIFFAPLILVAVALIAGQQGHRYMFVPYAAMIIIVSVGARLHTRMTMVNSSLEVITQNSTQPVQRILAFDYKAMFVLALVLIGITVLLNFIVFRPLLEMIVRHWPDLEWASTLPPGEAYLPMVDEPGMGEVAAAMMYGMELSEPPLIWRILEWLLFFALVPLIALAALFIFIRHMYNVIMQFRIKDSEDADHADGFSDVKEFIHAPSAISRWWRRPRNENKLRKLFRETVTRHIKKGVPINKSDTPVEMVTKIQNEDISTLAEDYAAIRYGK